MKYWGMGRGGGGGRSSFVPHTGQGRLEERGVKGEEEEEGPSSYD